VNIKFCGLFCLCAGLFICAGLLIGAFDPASSIQRIQTSAFNPGSSISRIRSAVLIAVRKYACG